MVVPAILSAQCSVDWNIRDDCGPILANGGIAPNSPPIFCEGQTVTFLNTTDPAAGVTKVYMDWGDGTCEEYAGNPPFFTHAYDVPDDSCISVPSSTYLLYMGVEKKCSPEHVSFHYIITPLAVMFKPVADPAPPQVICENEPALFLNQCHTPSNTTTVWTTSDGTILNGETFSHSFTTPGTHHVYMTVSNMCGADNATLDIQVTPTAVAAAALSDTALCLPFATLYVTNQSQYTIGQIWTVTPDVGYVYENGTGPGSSNPQIKFLQPGTYTLKMQAIGCGSPSWTKNIVVSSPPTITLDTIPNGCNSVVIDPNNYFTAGGGTATSISWTFSGGYPSFVNTLNAPPITFTGVGMHVAALSLSNHCGSVTLSDAFQILPAATASAMLSDTLLCIPEDTLHVINNSTNANGYVWWITPAPWGGFANGTGATSAVPVMNFTFEGLYTVHLKAFGCNGPEWSAPVRVRRKPDASLIQQIEDACFSAVVVPSNHITLSGGQADYINWTFSGGLPGSATGPFPPPVSFPDTGYHFVQVEVGNTCGVDTVQEGFTIFNPTVVTAVTPADSICRSSNSIQLQAIPNGGVWSGPGISATGLFDPAAGLNNAWNDLVYYYGPPDCRLYDTVHVFVMSTDVEAGPPLTRCINAGEVLLAGQSPAGGVWTGAGVTPDGIFDPAMAGAGNFVLAYTFTDANGCPNFDARQVTVSAAPTAVLAAIDDACVGTPMDFSTYTFGSTGINCNWTFGDGSEASSCAPYYAYSDPGNYTIELIVTAANGCRDTAQQDIAVHAIPDANFVLDQTEGCADLLVQINNTSTPYGLTTYHWNLGDGSMDTLFQPGQHVFTQGQSDTTYLLELTATNHCGQGIYAQQVTVFPKPQTRFSSDIDNGCTPLTVHFNNISTGNPTHYRWYINGILKDTIPQLPTQVFFAGATDSLYRVVLVLENACGNDTLQHDVLVHPNTVMAFAHIDTTIGCAPFTVHVANYSTDGFFANWDFGDGNTGIGDSVQHTYPVAGDYLIHLYVNNGCGYDTTTANVHVLPQPEVGFTVPGYVCYGDTLPFVNTSVDLSGCLWYFGDGSMEPAMTSPGHMYPAPGQYNVMLIGFAATTGCSDTIFHPVTVRNIPVAMAQLDNKNGCEPFSVQPVNLCTGGGFYLWDFGDGATSIQVSPEHTYANDGQYRMQLKVVDQYGCEDTCSSYVTVHPNPDLSFNILQDQPCHSPVTVSFSNTTVHADAYEWTFDNGVHSTSISPAVSVGSGPLGVHLFGTNMFGCEAMLDTLVAVYSQPNVEAFTAEQTGCAPFTGVFETVSQAVNHYFWTFGDGQSSSEANPIHRFDHPGSYRVQVIADHNGLCFDSSEVLVTVLPVPKAAFTSAALNDTTVVSNGIFLFNDASMNAVEWWWDFGDGHTSNVQNPVHRYLINGDKPITLVVANEEGCRDTISQLLKPDLFGNLFIPNTFSPELGADGAREFRPIGIGLNAFRIEVFATNGQRVWSSDKLFEGQPTEAWDGRFENQYCPPGVYWWKCSAILATRQPWEGMSFDGQESAMREGKLLLVR
ncbi:MAG TPA: PKD domain-containing protein [Saprospiraceae bacterium]|nr:PKD domain-containing protein [Saprospiraceae bacterium]